MEKYSVKQFVSSYKNANTFIIEINENDVLMIDLGNYPTEKLIDWLKKNNKNLIALFLTHEHADHCYGVDELKTKLDFTLYCSEKCEVNMRNPKQNFSRYIEEFETFGVQSEASLVYDEQAINFDGFEIKIMETPGHSPGGICLYTENMIFTGDTILNNHKSPLSFPHSNKKDFKASEKRILDIITPEMMIYPGHGEAFKIENRNTHLNLNIFKL